LASLSLIMFETEFKGYNLPILGKVSEIIGFFGFLILLFLSRKPESRNRNRFG
jgi:hypothetical protein